MTLSPDNNAEPVEPDQIDPKFKPGKGVADCPSCGAECEIQHSIIEFGEFIYCEECKMKFTRDRDPVVEHEYKNDSGTVIETPKEEKEEYVQFKCYRCDTRAIDQDYRIHEKTQPSDGAKFTPIETGMIGYDECSLVCPCGERHNGYLDIGEVIECECGRVYNLNVEES